MIEHIVEFQRLLSCLRYDENTEFTFFTPNYNGEAHLCISDVIVAIEFGLPEEPVYFGKNDDLNQDVVPTRNYHLGRVIYFMNHPDEITGIEIKSAWWMQDNKVCSHAHLQIEDGYHRVMAGMCLGWKNQLIHVFVSDYIRDDVLSYLLGKSSILPKNMRHIPVIDIYDTLDERKYHTYILQCTDGTLYTGWTTDLEARVNAHNRGKGAKFTKSRLPVELLYSESFNSKSEAMRREYQIKQMSRADKLKLIQIDDL